MLYLWIYIFLCLVFVLSVIPPAKRSNFTLIILLICYIVYCLIFIFRSSFVVSGIRYFTLFDDAMISMRYAKNLANGFGLVWNPRGEPVEGYSNFLWTLYMSFWHILPIHLSKISLFIQLTGLGFLLSSLFLVRKIAARLSGNNAFVIFGSVVLTAAYLPINFWALRGMETSVLGSIIIYVVWRVICSSETEKLDYILFSLLGIGILIRLDFVFLFITLTIFRILIFRINTLKNSLFSILLFTGVISGETILRWFYYRELLPNTYYLKITGFSSFWRIERGVSAFLDFVNTASPVIFIAVGIFIIFNRKNKAIIFLFSICLSQILYSIYVGGDAWETWGNFANRYLCIVMPIFFILLTLTIHSILKYITPSKIKNIISFTCVIFIIFQLHGGFKNIDLIRNQLLKATGMFVEIDKKMAQTGILFQRMTSSEARLAVTWAGAIPYFSDRYCIDILGKNDLFIARQKAKVDSYKEIRPGHNKYNYEYSIGRLKPDVITHYWGKFEEIAPYLNVYEPFLMKYGSTVYLLKNSKNIKWEMIKNPVSKI